MFVYLHTLTQSIAITGSIINFANFFPKNAVTFDLTEIEREKIYSVDMKCCWAFKTKNEMQNRKKKINFLQQKNVQQNCHFSKKLIKYFRILAALPVILTTYLLVYVKS